MTAVFTDAVPDLAIKIEPGLVTVKKEKLEEGEAAAKAAEKEKLPDAIENDKHGELFSQLVGEVNKLNEMGEEKGKETSSASNEEKDSSAVSDSSKVRMSYLTIFCSLPATLSVSCLLVENSEIKMIATRVTPIE